MSVTIRDLSRYCGLSVATVSKALNGYTDISEATREAVTRAARELGYYPNAHARALKSGRSYNLGVLFVDDSNSGLTHVFFSAVLESFKKEAEREGYDITFISHAIGAGRLTYLEHCRSREVDGVCIAAIDFSNEEVRELMSSSLPVVTIDHLFNQRTCVRSDNLGGMTALIDYIWECGHRRIAFIHGPTSASTDCRLGAYYRAAERLGFHVPEAYIRECQYNRPETLSAEFQALMRLPEPPTCILCSDDYAALGAYRAAGELGLRIPEDISIAGFDGIVLTQMLTPPLTTVRQNQEAIGRVAAERLISLITSPKTAIAEIAMIPCELIKGGSVRRLSR